MHATKWSIYGTKRRRLAVIPSTLWSMLNPVMPQEAYHDQPRWPEG